MKAAIIAAIARSPWALLGVAAVLLIALWLILSREYRFKLEAPDLRLELAPAKQAP